MSICTTTSTSLRRTHSFHRSRSLNELNMIRLGQRTVNHSQEQKGWVELRGRGDRKRCKITLWLTSWSYTHTADGAKERSGVKCVWMLKHGMIRKLLFSRERKKKTAWTHLFIRNGLTHVFQVAAYVFHVGVSQEDASKILLADGGHAFAVSQKLDLQHLGLEVVHKPESHKEKLLL